MRSTDSMHPRHAFRRRRSRVPWTAPWVAAAAVAAAAVAMTAAAPGDDPIPAEALRADLDAIVALHEEMCPAPYLRTDRAAIVATRDRLKASIDRPMSKREFLPKVMELQAAYGIDHMVMAVPQDELRAAITAGDRLLPFRARPASDALEVVAVSGGATGIEPGDRILRIGDRDAAQLIASFERLVPGENPRARSARIRDTFRALAWALGIAPPITLEVRRADGTIATVTLAGAGLDAARRERRAPEAAPPPRMPAPEVLVDAPPFRCSVVDGDIALIDFPSMNQSLAAPWSDFLDRAFRAIAERGCRALVVDIRRNGGGDSRLGDHLLARLTDAPFRLCAGVEIGSYARGDQTRHGARASRRPRVAPGFDGPSFLLIGEGTFSSAEMLADAARTYDLMTTIGQPTGGAPSSLGELGSRKLAASGLTVPYCQKKFTRASGNESEMGPVLPHIVVDDQPGRDAALDRAIQEARSRAAPPSPPRVPSQPDP